MPALQLEFPKDLLVVECIMDRPGAVSQLSSVSNYVLSKAQETSGEERKRSHRDARLTRAVRRGLD